MRGPVAIVLVLVLAGCGGTAGERAAEPQRTPDPALTQPGRGTPPVPLPAKRALPAAVRAALASGQVAVVDVTGRASVRPSSLEIAQDATLRGVRWSRWDRDGAVGRGTLRTLVCNPTCAQGAIAAHPATIELSAPAACSSGSWFSHSRVEVDGAPVPASYVRAPC
jgi:hypothetical protein